jgi:spore coat polysaccharide biosynthesis protein SpsF (cytidylyltransferase family)
MSTVCIIQARMSSTRLPGKSLMLIQGMPMIWHVWQRACAIGCDETIVAIPDLESERVLLQECQRLHINAMMVGAGVGALGPGRDDVLARYVWAAQQLHADETIVRVTGDCPLLAPDVSREVLRLYQTSACEYASNDVTKSGYPDGVDTEAFSRDALDAAMACAKTTDDREHVTPWIRRNRATALLHSGTDYSALKISVDTLVDLTRVRRIMARVPVSSDGVAELDFQSTIQAAIKAVSWHQ